MLAFTCFFDEGTNVGDRGTKMKRAIEGLVVLAGLTSMAGAAPLKSPWDAKLVQVRAASYSCPALKALPKDIEASDFYSDPKHSVIDEKREAAYRAAEAEFDQAISGAAKAADEFQATGNKGAAECVLKILDLEGAADAMTGTMSSNQANYVQNWSLGAFAVTWLKVRGADPGTPEQRKIATDWMAKVGSQVQAWFTARHVKGTNDGTNNHYYWAGFAAAGAGIAADDRGLYDWGIATYDEAISRIIADGTLPLEMARGQRALHYHLFALAPIVMLAEYGEANGDDLYSRRKGAVHLLVRRTIAGMLDNSFFAKQAGEAQDTPDKKEVKSTDVIWLVPYLKRFPNDTMNKVLHSATLKPYNYLGGLPPGWK
jgi:poly(beta-D-mannuronate) lyase